MKNKGKSLYFTIMGLVLAVTMMITSSITLAFFGASGGGSTTIKMGNAVTVDNVTEIKSKQIYVSPSELVDIDATATVKSPVDANSTTDAILRAKITSNSIKSANVVVVSRTTIGGDVAYWVKGFDGYYYLVTNQDGDTCYTIQTTTTGVEVPMQVSVMIPKTLSNADGGSTYSVTVLFCAIQARIYNDTGSTLIANTIKNTKPIFDQVEGTALSGKSLERIEGNSIQYSIPTPSNPAEVVSVGDRTKNLAEIRYDLNSNGGDPLTTRVVQDTTGIVASSLIEVDENQTYAISMSGTSTASRYFYYNEKPVIGSTISVGGGYGTPKTLTIPSGVKYLFLVWNRDINTYPSSNYQIEIGSAATTYEPYGYKIPVNITGGNNLLDNESLTDGYINSSGQVVSATWYHCSDYIEVSGKYVNYQNCATSSSSARYYAFYDENKTFISGGVQKTAVEGNEEYRVEIPSGARYFRVNVAPGCIDTAFVYLGSVSLPYEPSLNKVYNIYLDEPLRKVGNVADYIDFTTGKLVRNIKKAQIDENSSFGKFGGVTNYSAFYMVVNDMLAYSQHGSTNLVVMSNKFTYHTVSGGNVNSYWTAPYQIGGSLATTYTRICFSLPNTITDVASAKLWFADNPVEYYYPVATPTTKDLDI